MSSTPPLPESLEPPDVGVVAATGAYVAVCLVAVAVSVALAADGSAATVIGSVSSAATVGIVVGALLAGRVDGLAVRLGRRRRSRTILFVPPLAFAVATPVVLATPLLETAAAAGTALGALGSGIAALSFASMARERYARAITPDEPVRTIPWIDPTYPRALLGVGLGWLVISFGLWVTSLVLGGSGVEQPWWSALLGPAGFGSIFVGFAFVMVGFSYWRQAAHAGREERSRSWKPDRPRRKVLGYWASAYVDPEPIEINALEVYDRGFVVGGRRFVPWSEVADVRLTDSTLVVSRHSGRALRCYRSVLEEPEAVRETLERYATAAGRGEPPAGEPAQP